MNPFFTYLIKSSFSIALLYCLFRFAMRNDKSHVLNRFLLLGILIFSSVIPFLNIQFFYHEVIIRPVETIRDFVSAPVFTETNQLESSPNIIPDINLATSNTFNPWVIGYGVVIFFLLSRLLFGIIQVVRILSRAQTFRLKKIVLALVKDLVQPFTFLNRIVLSEKDFTENKDIVVTHEHAHIKQMHAIDLMVCELFTVVHFFNPFMWMLRHDLKLIHEFQADQAVLQKGIDAKKYQLLVLEKAVGERRFAMANHFTQKPILKRLKMMSKTKNQKWTGLKLILFVPVLIVLLQAFARPELITNSSEFIPVKYTEVNEDKTEKWLSKWTVENIGDGFCEPALKSPDVPKKPNNVLVILMNRNDEFLVENERHEKEEIKSIVKEFLFGINPNGGRGPDFIEKNYQEVGEIKVSQGIISYKHDLESSREVINYALHAIGEAYLEARNENAQRLFKKNYFDLDEEKQQVINEVVPVWFSYESPKSPTPNVWLPFDEKSSPPEPMNILFKKNGEVIVQNHRFNSLEEFQEILKIWNQELDEFNKDKRSKGYFRAHITFEDASMEEIKHIDYLLYKNNVHVEHIKQTSSERNLVSLENERLAAKKDQTLANAEKLKLGNDSTNILLKEEQQRAKTDKSLLQKVKLFSGTPVEETPPACISVTLDKNRNILYRDKKYNYDEFEAFLKDTYRGYRRKLELSAEVKWDTAVGYQGIHKLAKMLDKRGFEDTDFRPFNEDGFLPPPYQKQEAPKALGIIRDQQTYKSSWTQAKKNWYYANLNEMGNITTEKKVGEHGEFSKSRPIQKDDILMILLNSKNEILVNGNRVEQKKLDTIVADFVQGKQPNGKSVKSKISGELPFFGKVTIPQGVISLRFDISTSFVAVEETIEKMGKSIYKVRDEKSLEKFGKSFSTLEKSKQEAVAELIPIRITTGEPKFNKETEEIVFIK